MSQATRNGTTFSEQAPTNKAQAVAAREMFTYSTSTSGAKLHTAMRSSSSENGARSQVTTNKVNPTGKALVWYSEYSGSKSGIAYHGVSVFCFKPLDSY